MAPPCDHRNASLPPTSSALPTPSSPDIPDLTITSSTGDLYSIRITPTGVEAYKMVPIGEFAP